MQLSTAMRVQPNQHEGTAGFRLSFSRAIDILASSHGRTACTDPETSRAHEAADRYARHAVARIESSNPADATDWIDLAPELSADPGVHIVSRMGQCRESHPN